MTQEKTKESEEIRSFRIAEKEDASLGPVFAIIIIVTLLIMGALYAIKKVPLPDSMPTANSISSDYVVKDYSIQGTSDSAGDIARDLSATAIQALDQGLAPLSKTK